MDYMLLGGTDYIRVCVHRNQGGSFIGAIGIVLKLHPIVGIQ